MSVVIPTKDRPDDLARVLDALALQNTQRRFEVIVVDDLSTPPVNPGPRPHLPLSLVRGPGRGPAAARNLGIASSSGEVVLFTDDDTVPPPDWVEAAAAFLEQDPDVLGVEGPIESLPWDPLVEYSIHGDGPGHYWTANIAYRRSALDSVGGFAEDAFPTAHAEDRDLAFRVERLGGIGFSPSMLLVHVPRPAGFRAAYRRGLWSSSDIALERKHPDRVSFDNRVPVRFRYLIGGIAGLRGRTVGSTLGRRGALIWGRSLALQLSHLAGLVVAALRAGNRAPG